MAKILGSLTAQEKRVIKALLNKGHTNQDVNAWINIGRASTVNFGRIANIKKDPKQVPATDEELEYFRLHREAYDPRTGLNFYDNERLIRAREAMILAVQIFNSAALKFKTEVFCVLSNIAWKYLMHEYLKKKLKIAILNDQGYSIPLSEILLGKNCPLSEPIKQNLLAFKTLRDKVEHHTLGKGDFKWLGIFQACCLNFDKTICEIFGERLTLSSDLSFSLQFAKMNLEQATSINRYEIPEHIDAIDAQITKGIEPALLNNVEFQFQVVYTLTSAPKSKCHIQFVNPNSAEGKQIHNVLTKKVIADDEYPHKPGKVADLVASKSGKPFTTRNHQQAFTYFKVRPKKGSKQPENTDKQFCIYHAAHKDYTYSDAWVEKLVQFISDLEDFEKIKAVKLK